MMNTLLESKPRKQKSTGGTIFSVGLHSVIIFFAVYATARAGIPDDREKREEKVTFVKTKAPEPPPEVKKEEPPPPPKKAEPPKVKPQPRVVPLPPAPKAEIAPPKGFKVLEAPINIPTEIPKVDLTAKVTDEADFSDKGVEGSEGMKDGAAGGVDKDRNFAEIEVEQQVVALSGTNVEYPEGMRSSGVEGQVMAHFVVNESGRVETGTFKVLESTNDMFTSAVRRALSGMRFRPAKIGSTSVSQVVQQAFVFKLNK